MKRIIGHFPRAVPLTMLALMAVGGQAGPALAAEASATEPLTAVRGWVPAAQPMVVRVGPGVTHLALLDAAGRPLEDKDIAAGPDGMVDIRPVFATQLNIAGTYAVAAAVRGAALGQFSGTPLIVSVRADTRRGAAPGPMVTRILPLTYARIETDLGEMMLAFYWDAAPNSAEFIARLASEGFYNGLTFHRIEKGFTAQTGDPRGDGTGGPGMALQPEFSNKTHKRGVVSLSRVTDPSEGPGVPPRPEYAATGGSQWFISLSDVATKQLDRKYTVIGRIVTGLEVLEKLEKVPVDEKHNFMPEQPVIVRRVTVVPVTANDNPYAQLREMDALTGGN